MKTDTKERQTPTGIKKRWRGRNVAGALLYFLNLIASAAWFFFLGCIVSAVLKRL
jgi:hypothetical protein